MPPRGRPAGQAHVLAVGRGEGLFQGRLDAVVHKREAGAALHVKRGLLFMAQHEDRMVVRRIRAPPALPALLILRVRRRPEHMPAHDASPDVLNRLEHEIVVQPLCTSRPSDHAVEKPGGKGPAHQPEAVLPKRRVLALPRSGAEAVQGDGETTDDKLRHGSLPR